MRVKLFIEPLGKAREEVLLESCIPFKIEQIRQWRESWIRHKDYKDWSKELRSSQMLGEIRLGRVFGASRIEANRNTPLKAEFMACQSYNIDVTGSKKKLPMVLFLRLKKVVNFEYFSANMSYDSEQEKELKNAMSEDAWAPIAVWHPQPVDRKHSIDTTDVLPHAIQYAKALFTLNPKNVGLSEFAETEILKA